MVLVSFVNVSPGEQEDSSLIAGLPFESKQVDGIVADSLSAIVTILESIALRHDDACELPKRSAIAPCPVNTSASASIIITAAAIISHRIWDSPFLRILLHWLNRYKNAFT